ncbi:MAG: S8 family serine peptidase, partial [Planctomycetota bacterium]
ISGIWVDPAGFDVNLIDGLTLTENLTVGNDGLADLDYMIRSRVVGSGAQSQASTKARAAKTSRPAASAPLERDFTIPASSAYEPGELLVRFAAKADGKQRSNFQKNQILASLGGGTVKRNYTLVPGLSLVKLPVPMAVEQTLRTLNKAAAILYAEPNYEVKAISTFPNDPRFNDLWGMHNTGQTGGTTDADIDAPEAWDAATGGTNIVVAVIDTGVDYTHVDLAANMWVNEPELNGTPGVDDDGNGYVDDIYGYDFYNNDADPWDDHYHGTHCAGTIGAIGNNGEGVAGVCWNVRIMAVKFLDSSGNGSTSDAISCVQYSTLMGANLSSNSWGGGGYSQALKDAIDAAGAAGMLFAAAAGNDSENTDDQPHYPSSYDCESIISVMATDKFDDRSSFSNWGPLSVDLGAPGSSILSCQMGGGYRYANGTSMATPHVAGACALVWSVDPTLTNSEVKEIILGSVDKTLGGLCIAEGRLNLYNALLETSVPWITIEPEEGTIAPGQSNDISVTFDATRMTPGIYEAEIIIFPGDPCHPQKVVPVTMTVLPDDLSVLPDEDFESSGIEWGPFEPTCKSYILTNNGDTSVPWTVFWAQDWVKVEPNEGTLDPNESIEVDVCISPYADLLEPNIYSETVVFKNLDSNSIKPRQTTLIVKPPDMFTESFETYNDLTFLSLTFSPDGSASYYEACRARAGEFPTDPNGGTGVTFWDDDSIEVALENEKQILFYGQWYDRFYIGSNGYITFGAGDTQYSPTLKNHFSMPRISGLFTDLLPVDYWNISFKQLDDRVAVTYWDVPLYGHKDSKNSFQIEIFFVDGTIRITWLELVETASISGLSKGKGLPPVFFKQSNLNRYPACSISADVDMDYLVNFADFAWLAAYWRDADCDVPFWCGRSDLDHSGTTDGTDLGILADYWLVEEDWWIHPTSHWKFDEGAGPTAYDSAGDNHATVYGAQWTSGYIGGALRFDGTDDHLDVNDAPSLRFNQKDSFSACFWARPLPHTQGFVICKMRASGQWDVFGYDVLWNSTGSVFAFRIEASRRGHSEVYTFDDSAPAGGWYHVAAVYDDRAMSIYLNGELHETGTFSYDTGDTTPDKNLAIGARSYDSTIQQYFEGTIDDVRIYDRALARQEIAQMYTHGLAGRAFSPVPADGELAADPNGVLSWTPGTHALSHDVYFGTDFNDVNDANTTDPNVYGGNQDANTWDPCGLEFVTHYYWRIDERKAYETIRGTVWSFRTWSELGPDCVSWWKFDQGEGTTACDSAGSNHGTIHGATWTSGQIGGALDFDGTDDYVDVDDDPSLRFSQYDSFSMSFWARPLSAGYVLSKARADNCSSGIFGYHASWSDSKFHLLTEKSCVTSVILSTLESSAPPGAWYHVTCVYDNNDMNIYLDGDLQGSGTFGYDTGATTPDKNLAI